MQSALITGGEGDLAQAISRELKSQGYEVHAPGKAALNVADAASVRNYVAALPKVDLLVCNAALVRDQSVLEMTAETFAEVLSIGLSGAFHCAKAALKGMSKARFGHIIFIGSYSAWRGPAGQANYASAKAGLMALMQSLAAEYGSRNVRVNCILPGFMETKMTAHFTDKQKDTFREAHTLGRFNTVAEVARFIAFLDAQMPHTSGQVFNLDSRRHRWT